MEGKVTLKRPPMALRITMAKIDTTILFFVGGGVSGVSFVGTGERVWMLGGWAWRMRGG